MHNASRGGSLIFHHAAVQVMNSRIKPETFYWIFLFTKASPEVKRNYKV